MAILTGMNLALVATRILELYLDHIAVIANDSSGRQIIGV
jgi:hypothetical protein